MSMCWLCSARLGCGAAFNDLFEKIYTWAPVQKQTHIHTHTRWMEPAHTQTLMHTHMCMKMEPWTARGLLLLGHFWIEDTDTEAPVLSCQTMKFFGTYVAPILRSFFCINKRGRWAASGVPFLLSHPLSVCVLFQLQFALFHILLTIYHAKIVWSHFAYANQRRLLLFNCPLFLHFLLLFLVCLPYSTT